MDVADLDLAALGLSKRGTEVLRVMLDRQEATGATVARATGLSEATVSRAAHELADAGLLVVQDGRPPALLLPPMADAVRAIEEAVADRAERHGERLRELAARLEGVGSDKPGPPHRLVPTGYGGIHLELSLMQARGTLDAVLPARHSGIGLRTSRGPAADRPAPRARLLLCPDTVLRRRIARAEVRRHAHELPHLRLVDGERAVVAVRWHGTARWAWTTDPVEVAVLQRLFEALWGDAAQLSPR